MITIHKYEIRDGTTLNVGSTARVVHIGYQGNTLYAWILHDTSDPKVARVKFDIYGTGWDMPEDVLYTYEYTVQDPDGFVWHVCITYEF